jgi:prepilin-type N-terminal cleavage/methylation domain-containing protein
MAAKDSIMKRQSRPMPLSAFHGSQRKPTFAGFTLVEMLVVISIIGILAGLVLGAVHRAQVHAKNAAIALDLNQLQMACQAYKEKFGEYPPDFEGLTGSNATAVQNAILRHLAKAFPRYAPASWTVFVNDVKAGWQYDLGSANVASPYTALLFWLGGKPVFNGSTITGFTGFSANPQAPFDANNGGTVVSSTSRMKPFFDFDPTRVGGGAMTSGVITSPYRYWPQGAYSDFTTGAIAYFRAENGAYWECGSTTVVKFAPDPAESASTVYPAIDSRLSSSTSVTYINPSSVQIFSSGLDLHYGKPAQETIGGVTSNRLLYPAGTNYDDGTGYIYDNVTNFSNGTLESAQP